MAQLENKPESFHRGQRAPGADTLNQMSEIALRQIRSGHGVDVSYFNDRAVIHHPKHQNIVPVLPDSANYFAQFVVLREYDDCLLCTPHLPEIAFDYIALDTALQAFAIAAALANANPTSANITAAAAAYANAQSKMSPSGWVPMTYNPNLGSSSSVRLYVVKPYLLQKTPWNGRTVTLYGSPESYTYTDIGVRLVNGTLQETINKGYFPGDVITAIKAELGYIGDDGNPIVWLDANIAARHWTGPLPLVSGQGTSGAQTAPEFDVFNILTFVECDPDTGQPVATIKQLHIPTSVGAFVV